MEIKSTIQCLRKLVHFSLRVWILIVVSCAVASAQPMSTCTIKNGKMLIIVNKAIRATALDSFIAQYELSDLDLKQLIRTGSQDSLRKKGWAVEEDNKLGYILSKPLQSYNKISNPAEKIIFAEKNQSFAELFPVVSSQVKYGFNKFRNKSPFAVKDSFVTFFLRDYKNAKRVILSGSFSDWSTDKIKMTLTDSGWIAVLRLSPGKYWYKFIIDGSWTVDKDNQLVENDGLGNDNSVYYKPNRLFVLNSFTNAKRIYLSGSFNSWRERELQMIKTTTGWQLPVYLANGTHTYRYIVDGDWYEDPGNPDHYPNEFGQYNSVIRIGKPYLFHLDGYADAKQIVLSGSFNGWRRDELFMKKTSSGWELPYTLGPGNYEYLFIIDGKKEARPGNVNVNLGGKDGNLYFIIDPNYTFHLKGFLNAKKVYIAGDFNNWSPNTFAMERQGDEWIFGANLSAGKHLYKFVVDGKWIIDPANKLWEQNEHGTGNSVLWIGQ